MTDPALPEAVERLAGFLGTAPLTRVIAGLEGDLAGVERKGAEAVITTGGLDRHLLTSAIVVRRDLGRVSDLIHALAIVLALPLLLEDGERLVNRPSLAAGNDPSRPYDLETDRRIAEFKLSHWTGRDAMRKRQTFKDLVHLAADSSGRGPELFIVGPRPARFLRLSRTTAGWALDRSPTTRPLFVDRFGPLTTRVRDFTAGPAAHVQIIDVTTLLAEASKVATIPSEEQGQDDQGHQMSRQVCSFHANESILGERLQDGSFSYTCHRRGRHPGLPGPGHGWQSRSHRPSLG